MQLCAHSMWWDERCYSSCGPETTSMVTQPQLWEAVPHSLWLAMGDLAVHGTSGHGPPCDSQLSWLPLVTSVTRYCSTLLYTWSIVTIVTFGYQHYLVLCIVGTLEYCYHSYL